MHTKPSGGVEFPAQLVELPPERARDLEVVALVAHDVQERLVAAEREIFARRVGPSVSFRLPVRIAQKLRQRRITRHHPQRVGSHQLGTALIEHPHHDVAGFRREPVDHGREHPGAKRSIAAIPSPCPRRQPQRAVDEVGGIPPLVVGLDRQAERLPHPHHARQHRAPAHTWPGPIAILGLSE